MSVKGSILRHTRTCGLSVVFWKNLSLCFTWKDVKDEIWSLNIVTKSCQGRRVLQQVYHLQAILAKVKSNMESLDNAYQNLMLTQHCTLGGHQYPSGLTSKTFPNLVLDDSCPWEDMDIGYSIKLKCMKFLAALVWDIQLSATTTIVYKDSQQVDEPKTFNQTGHLCHVQRKCCRTH